MAHSKQTVVSIYFGNVFIQDIRKNGNVRRSRNERG